MKHSSLVSYKYKRRKCITVNSQVNLSESNHLNTSNHDNVIGNSNPPLINVHTEISFDKLITLQPETDTESSTSINN